MLRSRSCCRRSAGTALDATAAFKDWAPRLSATYDLFGTGKTVLKGTFAMYFDQGGLITNLGGNPAGGVELRAAVERRQRRPVRPARRDQPELELSLAAGNFDLTTGLPRNLTSAEHRRLERLERPHPRS